MEGQPADREGFGCWVLALVLTQSLRLYRFLDMRRPQHGLVHSQVFFELFSLGILFRSSGLALRCSTYVDLDMPESVSMLC